MEGEKNKWRTLIGSIIIVVILILGGIFLWRAKMNEPAPEPEDNYAQIESELNGMDLDGLDSDI